MCECSHRPMTRLKTAPLRSECSNRFITERLHPLLMQCLPKSRQRKGVRPLTSRRKRPNHRLVEVIAIARSVNGSLHPPLLKTSRKRKTRNQNLLSKCSVAESTHSQASISSHQTSHQSQRQKKSQLPKSRRRILAENLSSKHLPIHSQKGLHLKRRPHPQPLAWELACKTTNQEAWSSQANSLQPARTSSASQLTTNLLSSTGNPAASPPAT